LTFTSVTTLHQRRRPKNQAAKGAAVNGQRRVRNRFIHYIYNRVLCKYQPFVIHGGVALRLQLRLENQAAKVAAAGGQRQVRGRFIYSRLLYENYPFLVYE